MRLPISPFEAKFRIFAFLLNLFAIAIFLFGLLSARDLTRQIQFRAQIVSASSQLRSALLDLEAVYRAYFLDPRPQKLDQMRKIESAIVSHQKQLQNLVPYTPGGQARLDALSAKLENRLGFIHTNLRLVESGQRILAIEHLRSNMGQLEMDLVRAEIGELQQATLQAVTEKVATDERHFIWILLLGSASAIIGVIGVVTSHFHFRRFQRESQQMLDTVSAAESRLRKLSQRLQEVREEENRSLARRVHDDLGQNLTALRFDLNALARLLRPDQLPPDAAARLQSALTLAADTHEQARTISRELRPAVIDQLGLPAALEWLAGDYKKRFDGPIETGIEEAIPDIPPNIAITAFRIAQEALNNIVRHAPGATTSLILESLPSSVRLTVSDNGPGFSLSGALPSDSFGLLSMQEQALAAGAQFAVSSSPGQGTSISVTMPISALTAVDHAG